ncbi:MAG: hypothetical protein WC750_04600 [Patescibacteria group bacterium]|jgi:hypothetical protein
MSFEKNDSLEELKQQESIRSRLSETPLDCDTLNDWIGVFFGANPAFSTHPFPEQEPILHYHEYQLTRRISPAQRDLIMQLSDPRAIEAYDQLVDEFNSDLEQIVSTRDAKKCKEYAVRVRKLFEKTR